VGAVAAMYSHSQLEAFKACPLKWRLRYGLHLHRIAEQRGVAEHHLAFGAAGHDGLRRWYETGDVDAAVATFEAAYPTQLDPRDKGKTRANGAAAIRAYVEKWRDEDAKYKVLENEAYTVVATGDWSQHLDGVWEDTELGGIYAVDHKFTKKQVVGAGGGDFWSKFSPNSQVTGYIDYVEERYGECSGFIVNAISLGFNSRRSALHDAGPWVDFGRRTFQRQPKTLRRNREDRALWISRIEAAAATGQYGTNTDSCGFCTFKAICGDEYEWDEDADVILGMYEQLCGYEMQDGRRCNLPWHHDEGPAATAHAYIVPPPVEDYEITEDDAVTAMWAAAVDNEGGSNE
jgi:hypothetical protein